ncbi:1850_t:CDS:2, partial [Gigaspora margarita]
MLKIWKKQQIKRVRGIEIKGKTPQWFQKLEQTVLENKITRSIKEVFIQVNKINEAQLKPEKRKLSHKRSKKEWEETNKENLSHNSPLISSIVPTNKILKVKENEVEDVSSWIKCKNKGGWATKISLKHLKNLIAPGKSPFERKESKIEHV